jgi:predicted dithiol-disulfide oxidoreductase (DUF899 family)
MGVTFPNESPDYRVARNKLLQREVALRREMEAVAAEIRALPPGGPVPEDYEFDHIDPSGTPAKVRLSELFRPGTDTLILYHYGTAAMSGAVQAAGRWQSFRLRRGRAHLALLCSTTGRERYRTLRGWERTSRPWPKLRSSGSRPSRRIAAGAI